MFPGEFRITRKQSFRGQQYFRNENPHVPRNFCPSTACRVSHIQVTGIGKSKNLSRTLFGSLKPQNMVYDIRVLVTEKLQPPFRKMYRDPVVVNVQKDWSELQQLHTQCIQPATSKIRPLALPPETTMLELERDADTKKKEMTRYFMQAVDLVQRLNWLEVEQVLLLFLASYEYSNCRKALLFNLMPQSISMSSFARSTNADATFSLKSPACFDPVGRWTWSQRATLHNTTFTVPHVLTLGDGGTCTFEAYGHANGGSIRANGKWYNRTSGTKLEVTASLWCRLSDQAKSMLRVLR